MSETYQEFFAGHPSWADCDQDALKAKTLWAEDGRQRFKILGKGGDASESGASGHGHKAMDTNGHHVFVKLFKHSVDDMVKTKSDLDISVQRFTKELDMSEHMMNLSLKLKHKYAFNIARIHGVFRKAK